MVLAGYKWWHHSRGVRYAKSLLILYLINISQNPLIDIAISLFFKICYKSILISFTKSLIDIDIFRKFIINIDIDIFQNFLVDIDSNISTIDIPSTNQRE